MESTSGPLPAALRPIDSLHSLAAVLNTGLDRRMIPILLDLMDAGVHPEALAESKSLKARRF
jgi:hypothetical protein